MNSYSVHASFKKKVMSFLGCAGGKISLDKEGNAAIYGASTDAASILAAPSSTHNPPDALKPLYDELNEIAADAEGDRRKWSGFKKHWHPDTSAVKPKQG